MGVVNDWMRNELPLTVWFSDDLQIFLFTRNHCKGQNDSAGSVWSSEPGSGCVHGGFKLTSTLYWTWKFAKWKWKQKEAEEKGNKVCLSSNDNFNFLKMFILTQRSCALKIWALGISLDFLILYFSFVLIRCEETPGKLGVCNIEQGKAFFPILSKQLILEVFFPPTNF